jgi:hypothetical protein
LISTLSDAQLGIDSAEVWKVFDEALSFEMVQMEYRGDVDRLAKWSEYAARLEERHKQLGNHLLAATRATQRMVKQIELKAGGWRQLSPIRLKLDGVEGQTDSVLFNCYSHKDEQLRKQLENHLTMLRRQGVIRCWSDRMISAGREWEGQIDQKLERAQVILLLVSADFLASDYCYDVEMRRALERHEAGTVRVIPVILRACDWSGAPFGKLKALPKDAVAVTSWPNQDEAFTDVAKGIRMAVEELRAPQ